MKEITLWSKKWITSATLSNGAIIQTSNTMNGIGERYKVTERFNDIVCLHILKTNSPYKISLDKLMYLQEKQKNKELIDEIARIKNELSNK